MSTTTTTQSTDPSLPPHTLLESPNARTITINDWRITACTHPISNASECDALYAFLNGTPLPEMTFGSNLLTLEHTPSKWKYTFSTPRALAGVKNGELQEGDGGVKVGTDPSSVFSMPKTVPTKPYDWTYTTTYAGHQQPWPQAAPKPSHSSSTESLLDADTSSILPRGGPDLSLTEPAADELVKWVAADPEDPTQSIPMAELTRPDPILFYAEIPLFEDELHDNGSSILLVRIRVMPTCFFILSRFTLRVDNVLFRQFDTRIFHSFATSSSSPLLIRETSGWEAPYELIQRQLPRRDDLTPLTDPSFIAQALNKMSPRQTQKEGAKTGWRALGTKREVAQLTVTSS